MPVEARPEVAPDPQFVVRQPEETKHAAVMFTESKVPTEKKRLSGESKRTSLLRQSSAARGTTVVEFESWSAPRKFVFSIVANSWFSNSILCVIVFNTLLITFQTVASLNMRYSYYFNVIDNFLLGIYIWELLLKLFAYRSAFHKSGWNLFDAFIVSTSVIEPVAFSIFQSSASSLNPAIFRLLRSFRAFKAVRSLRVLRTISFFSSLQIIVNTLLRSIPAMTSIVTLLLLVIYVFAILGVQLFKEDFPQRFGDIPRAVFALFQLITLDDWFEYYDAVPTSIMMIYLIVFIIVETFICLNLFIAVIVSNLENAQQKEESMKRQKRTALSQEMVKLETKERHSNEKAFEAFEKSRTMPEDESDTGSATQLADATALPATDAPALQAEHDGGISVRERPLVRRILQLLASLDYTSYEVRNNQGLLDTLIDLIDKEDDNS